MTSPPPVIDRQGRRVQLDKHLASGGEGSVFTLPHDTTRLAKVYHQPPSPQTAEKLAVMTTLATPKLLAVSAWPSDLLYHASSRQVAGFVMPRLTNAQAIQQLYNPVQRLRHFPTAGWTFLLRVASNLAAAFDEVHRAGCLVGDVNQSNVLVSSQALVRLIDCDSFQVRANGRQWLCEVGVGHYIPPELQGKPLRGLVRTENHDRFGLAVLLYQLLFVGRHPYAGIYRGVGDPSFEQLIKDFRFAQGPMARSWGMDPPPHTPTFSDIPPQLGMLFRRSFERGSENNARPRPAEWLTVLKELEQNAAECASDPGHKYWRGVTGCVWCRIANHGGPEYFFGVGGRTGAFSLDNAKLQEVINRLNACSLIDFPTDRKTFLPDHPPQPRPLPADVVDPHEGGFWHVIWAWIASFFSTSPWYEELDRRKKAHRSALHDLKDAEENWKGKVRQYKQEYSLIYDRVSRSIAQCKALVAEYKAELDRLTASAEVAAKHRHLQLHSIADAEIDKIGAGRKQLLAQFQVYTAADVEAYRIRGIKGFGPALTGILLAWKMEVIARFRFDPATGLSPAEQRTLTVKFRAKQQQIIAQMTQRMAELEQLGPAYRRSLEALYPDLKRKLAAWDQAKSDLGFMEGE